MDLEKNIGYDVDFKGESIIINGTQIQTPLSGQQALAYAFREYLANAKLDGLYNKAVFWPAPVRMLVEEAMRWQYSLIATQHCYDKLAKCDLPQGAYRSALYGEVVEATITNGNVQKVVTRQPSVGEGGDMCFAVELAVNPFGMRTATIRTAWVNGRNEHKVPRQGTYVKDLTPEGAVLEGLAAV